MASLANQTISSTYDGLVKTSTDQPVPISGVQLLEDGVGNSLALSVGRANQGVTITGTLSATSISGVLADGVTATTQTAGDNSTKVATTAYVDAATPEVDLDLAGDSGTGTVDLATQSLTIAGTANEIETSASGQTITIGLPSSVTVGTLTATTLAGTLSTAAQTNITSVGTLSSLAVSGNLTVDTNTLVVDAANNRVGIGTSSPSTNFHISGSGAVTARVESSGTDALIRLVNTTATTGEDYYISSINTGDLIFVQAGVGERMRIDSSGNVGIGTSSVDSKLHIESAFTPSASAQQLKIENTTTGQPSVLGMFAIADNGGAGNAGAIYFDAGADGSSSNNILAFNADHQTDNNYDLVLTGSGNVGIGTSSPSEKLHVAGGNIKLDNGYGIDFSASAGGGATSSLLDDYEEGTWTPVIRGSSTAGTYEIDSFFADYTKIGRQVNLNLKINLAGSITGGGTGYLQITGAPFTKKSNSEPTGSCRLTNVDFTGSFVIPAFVTGAATNILYLNETVDNGQNISLPITAISANDIIFITITYFV